MKSIVFSSSQRFADDLSLFIDRLDQLAGKRGVRLTILHPEFEKESKDIRSLHEKDRLQNEGYRREVAGKVYDHLFRKVKVADICFIFNKNGYIGANVNGELFAAAMAGKMIYALEDKTLMGTYPHDLYEEPSSRKFIHKIVSTPEELLEHLI